MPTAAEYIVQQQHGIFCAARAQKMTFGSEVIQFPDDIFFGGAATGAKQLTFHLMSIAAPFS